MGRTRQFGRSKAGRKGEGKKGTTGMNGTDWVDQEESQPHVQSVPWASCVHTFTYRTKQVGGDEQKRCRVPMKGRVYGNARG